MRRRWGALSAATLVVLLGLTGLSTWAVRDAVRSQEDRLLRERANEVSLVLKQAVDSVSSQLRTVGGVLQSTDNSPAAFRRSSAALVGTSKRRDTVALLRDTATGYRVELVDGGALTQGQLVTGTTAETLTRAGETDQLVPTQVMGSGSDRSLGLALGPPTAPVGTVLYLQISLGFLGPPMAANTAPFNELHVVLYGAPIADQSQALVSTTTNLPLRGDVRTLPFTVGEAVWTLQVSPAQPLVGATTANAAWIAAGGGIVVSVLLALVLEIETRRRRSALALYRSEHQLAEALQRSLLPSIPTVDRLELAACYLPGSTDQQVGGDWYDAFELEGGRVGLAIGDVLGHDIEAAALMSQVQTALRAYAVIGEQPAAVLERLDALLATLNTERLVTVFYGVLGPAAPDGSRTLDYANAGHPTPLVRDAHGVVADLDGATSVLLGVTPSGGEQRPQRSVTVAAGSMLVLYTDGLVEVPGVALSERLDALRLEVSSRVGELSVPDVCDWLLERVHQEHRRDDVAILVSRLPDTSIAKPGPITDTGRRARWGRRRLGASASSR